VRRLRFVVACFALAIAFALTSGPPLYGGDPEVILDCDTLSLGPYQLQMCETGWSVCPDTGDVHLACAGFLPMFKNCSLTGYVCEDDLCIIQDDTLPELRCYFNKSS
jgi:hypothetical protein